MTDTIRALRAEAEVARDYYNHMSAQWKPIVDAAVKWRVLDNAETRGALIAAIDAAEGK